MVEANLLYFTKRAEQIQYAGFAEKGYSIGSGAVESGNKLVVEARLKGSGMHWAPENVNPMVALRTVACSDRWEEAWPQISERLRERTQERALCRQVTRRNAKTARDALSVATEIPMTLPSLPPEAPLLNPLPPIEQTAVAPIRPPRPRKPAADHPWRRQPIGKAAYRERRLLAS